MTALYVNTENVPSHGPRRWVFEHVSHGVRHTILRPAFWLGLTLGFPLEHLLWEKLWPFDILTRWLGL